MIGPTNAAGPSSRERLVLTGIVGAALISMTPLVPVAGEVLLVIGVVLGWWLVPHFWRSALIGAIAGVVSGVLVLGVGYRMAMRVVAILDPIRTPELTLEGTMFILLGIGGIFGGILGILTNLARRGLGLSSLVAAAVLPSGGALGLVLVDDQIRSELFDLGAGAWMNISMFGLVAILFGLASAATSAALEERTRLKPAVTQELEVRA